MAFVEGDEQHRTHSGSKGGLASNNAGPLIDIALLSEAPVRQVLGRARVGAGWGEGTPVLGQLGRRLALPLLCRTGSILRIS